MTMRSNFTVEENAAILAEHYPWVAQERLRVCKASAARAGWFEWFGVWLHIHPHETMTWERPPYFIGSLRDLCLSQGLETGEGLR